jgi:hypothetical protein
VTSVRHVAWVLLLVSACFHPSYDHPACSPDRECPSGFMCNSQLICDRISYDDAATDADPPIVDGAPLDGKVQPVCKGAYVNICVDPPQAALTLTTQKIDTTNSALCAAYTSTPNTPDACVIAGQSITIPSNNLVTVVGNRKLILISTGSTGSITIAGTLDAAGHGRTSGPAGSLGPCGVGAKNPTRGTPAGGGGWGGSFGNPGNNGGNSASSNGGLAASAIIPTALRGGCPGSDGADNFVGSGGGDRGGGGGAVLLVANSMIAIDGTVNASGGAGGRGGNSGGGGGGGGSGGMIVLDAATVSILGKCFANGGGGGGGGNVNTGRDGAESKAPDQVGSGGQGSSPTGGEGGNGAFGMTGSRPGGNGVIGNQQMGGDGGGGGGGGGVGAIKVFSTNQSGTDNPAKVSPLPS